MTTLSNVSRQAKECLTVSDRQGRHQLTLAHNRGAGTLGGSGLQQEGPQLPLQVFDWSQDESTTRYSMRDPVTQPTATTERRLKTRALQHQLYRPSKQTATSAGAFHPE
ncbi:hypothetical protein CBL_09211 [Carabus blaptoides fortunei]